MLLTAVCLLRLDVLLLLLLCECMKIRLAFRAHRWIICVPAGLVASRPKGPKYLPFSVAAFDSENIVDDV